MGSSGNCDSYHLEEKFLDGEFISKTENYWYEPRGASVTGPKTVLILVLKMELKIRPSWLGRYELTDYNLELLSSEIKNQPAIEKRVEKKN